MCLRCKESKTTDSFGKDKNRKDGYYVYCKICNNKNSRKNYRNRVDGIKVESKSYGVQKCTECGIEFTSKAPNQTRCTGVECKEEYRKRYNKKYHKHDYIKNKAEIKRKVSIYQKENRPKINEYLKRKHKENPEICNSRLRKYKKYRRLNDVHYRLYETLSSRIQMAVKHQKTTKSNTSTDLLGCLIPEYKEYLQSLFTQGMTWDNYGKWQIDHIIPCSLFDLTDEKEQKLCFNYANTQPLWAADNLRKSNKLNWKG